MYKKSLQRHTLMFHAKHVPVDCKVCGKKLRNALHLMQHMSVSHRKQPYKMCHICGAKLKTDQGLKSHLAEHKGVKSHMCEVCGAGFVRRTSWRRHVIEVHSSTTFKCDICTRAFTTDYALHTHMLSIHQQGVYFNNRLKSLEALGYVVDKEAITRHLHCQCVICGLNLTDGKCSAHPNDYILTFDCNICEFKASHIKSFHYHLKNHHPSNFRSSVSGAPKEHKSTNSIPVTAEAVTCRICHKRYNRREYLSAHMKQHKEKAFSCPECGKKFTYKCNMKSHLVIHSEDKPFKCKVCEKSFKRQEQLTCHARVHDPDRSPFKCSVCGKGLTRNQNLLQHYRVVHPDVQVPQSST